MKPAIIAIMGAPGTGKTFLAQKLGYALNASTILEDNIPDAIIDNLRENKNPVQTLLWFRNRTIKNMGRAIELKEQGKTTVMDTYWVSNILHIPAMTSGLDKEILLEQAEIDQKYLPHPDVVIHLEASEQTIINFVKQRGRDFDTSEKYIQRILDVKKTHDEYFRKNREFVVCINRDNLDFSKEEDLKKVIEAIEKVLSK